MKNPRRTLEYDVQSEPYFIPLLEKVNLLTFFVLRAGELAQSFEVVQD
jgi:hypothetical protein